MLIIDKPLTGVASHLNRTWGSVNAAIDSLNGADEALYQIVDWDEHANDNRLTGLHRLIAKARLAVGKINDALSNEIKKTNLSSLKGKKKVDE